MEPFRTMSSFHPGGGMAGLLKRRDVIGRGTGSRSRRIRGLAGIGKDTGNRDIFNRNIKRRIHK